MIVVEMRHLEGVNPWFSERSLQGIIADVPEEVVTRDVIERLAAWFDQLQVPPHQSGAGDRLRQAVPSTSAWGVLLCEVAGEFQFLCGNFACARTAEPGPAPGVWRAILVCQEFAFAEACLL